MSLPRHTLATLPRPLAIAMWDFSWVERRWPGAGYEDWDLALDELVERGYDAVRIDAFPHLLAAEPERVWKVLPTWSVHDWGAPVSVSVKVWPELPDFIRRCAARGVKVALSSWFKDDSSGQRARIVNASAHARIWERTLALLEAENLLGALVYVDLCNEWRHPLWASFFVEQTSPADDWRSPKSMIWIRESIAALRTRFPDLAFTYSLCQHCEAAETWTLPMPDFDLLEIHQWMAGGATDFYERVGYHYERWEPKGYAALASRAALIYQADPLHWKEAFAKVIDGLVSWSLFADLPLATSEGWALVDYKDGPNLPWDWVLEFNAWAVERASRSGRWSMLCTSNFCGPQFRGMWREIGWHRRLTDLIKAGRLPPKATLLPTEISLRP